MAVFTTHRLFGWVVFRTTWYCPNNICWRGKARRLIVSLPVVLAALPLMHIICLTREEVYFLEQNMIVLHGFEMEKNCNRASLIDLRINVSGWYRYCFP